MACRRHEALRRSFALLVFGCSAAYCYLWRHYIAIVLTPPSSYHPREHYEQTFGVVTTSSSVSTAADKNNNSNEQDKLVKLRRQELTESLPDFLTDYVHWHARVRSSGLLNDNRNTTRILLVSIGGHHVGGLADRLRSLPYLLWEAQRTDRLFLMEWTNPCAMEEFLLPPLGGIDWTVPTHWKPSNNILWYDYDAQDNIPIASTTNVTLSQAPVLMVRHSRFTLVSGIPLLVKKLNVTTWTDPIMSRIFKVLLTLSPPVQRSMDETMQRLQLTPNSFDAIHLRARYPGTSDAFDTTKSSLFSRSVDADGFQWTPNAQDAVLELTNTALDCLLSQQQQQQHKGAASSPPSTIYFASDTNEAVKLVTTTPSSSSSSWNGTNINMVGLVTSYERFHLDRNEYIGLIRKTPPSAFYPAFVDLWILSQARCLVAGKGGYGTFASILGGSDCLTYFQKNKLGTGANAKYCPGVVV